MHTQLSFWSPICFDPFKKCSFVKVCANMQNLDSLKLRLKTLQVWMDNVPSDVLIEDLIAWLAWPAHNRAYLIPRPFIRHRLHWSLYNYIMYLGQESSILYFIYWVQLLIKKGIGNTALFYAHLKIWSHQIWCYWEIFDYLLGLRCCLYLQHISSQTVKVSVLQFILKKKKYIA